MMGFQRYLLPEGECDYVIVLGAQVRGNKISRTLERRLDKAVEYAPIIRTRCSFFPADRAMMRM